MSIKFYKYLFCAYYVYGVAFPHEKIVMFSPPFCIS